MDEEEGHLPTPNQCQKLKQFGWNGLSHGNSSNLLERLQDNGGVLAKDDFNFERRIEQFDSKDSSHRSGHSRQINPLRV